MIDAYHRLFQIEKSFRMSKHDLQARPIYHHKRDSIEAHLTIVFAALAVSRWIEDTTGWSIKKFVRTARRYRTIEIQAGPHTITAADPLPDDLARRPRTNPPLKHYALALSQVGSHRVRVGGSETELVDGRPVAVSGGEAGTVRVWDLAIGTPSTSCTALRPVDYVRVCGSLVTDPGHIGGAGTSASYNHAATIWQGSEGVTSPSNPRRWTEMHPPDLIQRVSELPAEEQNQPGTSTLWGVAVCCASFVLSPVEVFSELNAQVQPLAPRPPGSVAAVQEFVGPETVFSSIVEGNAVRNGAQLTAQANHVGIHVKVRGAPFNGTLESSKPHTDSTGPRPPGDHAE